MNEYKTIFVSPNGNDINKGTIENPFATIERAMREVRKINKSMSGDIIVYLRGGEYSPCYKTIEKELANHLDENKKSSFPLRISTLEFMPEDGGKNGFNVVYTAYKDEKPIITGGKKLSSWEIYDKDKNIYCSYLGIETRHLYINGKRAVRAKSNSGLPNNTELNINCHIDGEPTYITDYVDILGFRNIDKVEFVYNSGFTFPRCCVERVEKATDGRINVYMKQPGFYYCSHKGGTSVNLPDWIENAFELLNSPNEFYYDYSSGYIYYIPDKDVDMANVNAVVPVIDVLLSLKGKNKNEKVENIKFQNINFEYTGWLRPSYNNGHSDSQNNHIREFGLDLYSCDGDSHANSAIELDYAKNILFEDCKICNTGITALKITKASHNNLIQGCEFYDTSGSAIVIGDIGWRDEKNKINVNSNDEQDLLINNAIKNCYIHNCATEYLSAAPIAAAYTVGTAIENNDVVNSPYSAMHIGYGWGEVENVCTRDMKICNNYIDTFMAKLFDGGAIYTLGATGGSDRHPNLISRNFIRNQIEPKFGALYFDEGSSNWNSIDNVFENTPMWCHVSVLSPKNNNITVKNSYITNGYLLFDENLKQENIVVENPIKREGNRFDNVAEEIIKNAGLQGKYKKLRNDYDNIGSIRFKEECISLKTNEKINSDIIVRTIRGVILNDINVEYSIDDNDVAEIDKLGVIKAKKSGKCAIVATVRQGNNVFSTSLKVYVNDKIISLIIKPEKTHLRIGTSTSVKLFGETIFERQLDIGNYILYSKNNLLRVNNKNIVCALESGNGILCAEYNDLKASVIITVTDKPTGDPLTDFIFWDNNSCSKIGRAHV